MLRRTSVAKRGPIAVSDPSKPDRLHACERNFRAGEQIDVADLVERQRVLLERRQLLKEAAREHFPEMRRDFTVAEAILTDSRMEGAVERRTRHGASDAQRCSRRHR